MRSVALAGEDWEEDWEEEDCLVLQLHRRIRGRLRSGSRPSYRLVFCGIIKPLIDVLYSLQQLNDMGFFNASQNIRALQATGGNVHAAIEYILGGGGL